MYAEVIHTQQLTPSLLRMTLGGGTLDHYEPSAATDAYLKAQFVPNGSPIRVPYEADDLIDIAAEHRPRPRRVTVRNWNADTQTLTIDFVVHGDVGYAGSWALRAQPGDRLQFTGPGGSYQPSPEVDWHLLAGDESTLGAIGASLESLAEDRRAMVFVVVDAPGSEIELPSAADVEVTWLYRSESDQPELLLSDAIATATFPTGTFDVFLHGEAGEVRETRKHLVAERGVDPETASISPYWRRRHTDEDWRAVKKAWIADQANDV